MTSMDHTETCSGTEFCPVCCSAQPVKVLSQECIHCCASMHECIWINCCTVANTVAWFHWLLDWSQYQEIGSVIRIAKKKSVVAWIIITFSGFAKHALSMGAWRECCRDFKKEHDYVQQFSRVVMDTWKEDPYEDKSFRGLRKTWNRSTFLLHSLLIVWKDWGGCNKTHTASNCCE